MLGVSAARTACSVVPVMSRGESTDTPYLDLRPMTGVARGGGRKRADDGAGGGGVLVVAVVVVVGESSESVVTISGSPMAEV